MQVRGFTDEHIRGQIFCEARNWFNVVDMLQLRYIMMHFLFHAPQTPGSSSRPVYDGFLVRFNGQFFWLKFLEMSLHYSRYLYLYFEDEQLNTRIQ